MDQEQIQGYEVESVKLLLDPLTQKTLTQEFNNKRKGRKLTKKALWGYAKKFYKTVTYVQSTAGRMVVDLSEHSNNISNPSLQNKATTTQSGNGSNNTVGHKQMDALSQIPESKSQMLADPNATLGLLIQYNDQLESQQCEKPDLPLMEPMSEREFVQCKDASNKQIGDISVGTTEGVLTTASAPKATGNETAPPDSSVPDAMIVDENFLHHYYLDQKQYGDVMGEASGGPKLPKKCGSKSSSSGPKKKPETATTGSHEKSKVPPTWSETQRAIDFLNEFYGEVDENGCLIPPTDAAIQQRTDDVRAWQSEANKPRYPPIQRGDTKDEFEFPENEISEDERQCDATKEYLIIDDRYEEVEIEETATHFVASELGLDEKCTDKYFSKCKTQCRIEELRGRKVDVYNKNHQVLATWTIIEKSLEDPVLMKERNKTFAANGVRGAKFNSPVFDFEQYFWDLWPGSLSDQLEALNVRIDEHNRNVGPSCFGRKHILECTMSEYKTFIAITIAATCYQPGDAPLWQSKTKGIVIPARFGRFMTLKRFKALCAYVPYIMSNTDLETFTPWWMIDRYLCNFVRNRKKLVASTCWKVLDELMSAFRPRTRKTGNLPHLLYLL